MANLKAIRKRIQGVTGTQQLTRAMKLVAAAKLRKAQEAAVAQRAYADRLAEMINQVGSRLTEDAHPLLAKRDRKHVLLVAFTSDRGMCGAFNLNVCRAVEQFLADHREEIPHIDLAVIGKKGYEYLTRRDHAVLDYHDSIFADVSYENIASIGTDLCQRYIDGQYDALYVMFNWFRSAVVQKLTRRQVLPVELPEDDGDTALIEHVFEPDRVSLLDTLMPMHVNVQLYQALLESVASEMGARMTAMDNATNNAGDLIKRLTLIYNKARQETITRDLMDIVGGAEALK